MEYGEVRVETYERVGIKSKGTEDVGKKEDKQKEDLVLLSIICLGTCLQNYTFITLQHTIILPDYVEE